MRKISSLILCLVLIFSISLHAFGANKVDTIDIEAVLYKDGSMYVTQIWDGNFDEGTEIYIPMNASDYLAIYDLKVSDINGSYQTLSEWDVDKSFEEKANKCGIIDTDSGYEICFGISEYGHNRYAIEYRLANVIGSYVDMDGVNFRFVNDQMNTAPTDIQVEIRLADGTPITDENADIWAFGYDGQVEFSDGAIIAYTQNPLYSENHVTVMFSLSKGILSPARQEQGSFEAIKEIAFEGSDYNQSDEEYEEATLFETLLGMTIIIGILIVLVAFFLGRSKKVRSRRLHKFAENQGYFRDLPNGGNENATYLLGKQFELCEDGAILSLGILKLINIGCLEPIIEEEIGFLGKTIESVNLRLMGSHHESMNEYDEYLYTVFEVASGADGILQKKELGRYVSTNDKILRHYINKCDIAGKNYLNQCHCLKRWDIPSKLKYLTPEGEKEMGELLGFKKYLEDFSLIAERSIKEMPIWKELLSYAMLFGIADQLAEQMKELYPNIATEVNTYNKSLTMAHSYHYLMVRNLHQAENQREQEKRTGGSGGFSSHGGGGGFIGGGSSGGTR